MYWMELFQVYNVHLISQWNSWTFFISSYIFMGKTDEVSQISYLILTKKIRVYHRRISRLYCMIWKPCWFVHQSLSVSGEETFVVHCWREISRSEGYMFYMSPDSSEFFFFDVRVQHYSPDIKKIKFDESLFSCCKEDIKNLQYFLLSTTLAMCNQLSNIYFDSYYINILNA